jgi:hypothetical protein
MSTAGDQPAVEPDSPEAIRADIDETRSELGDTVEALAQKTDVKGRAEDRLTGIKQDARAKADQLKQKATSVTPESARQSGEQLVTKARANPMALAGAAAVALVFLLGRRSARP